MSNLSHRFCVAPMMEWTDRHCRTFHRILSRHARLYTEMVTAEAVLHGDRERLLGFGAEEHPLALQLGGSDPAKLADAAAIGEAFGYDEINLNVGCPSSRVQEGRFGACLMAEPELVAACVRAMADRVRTPVTVKCRIGIDDQDSEADLTRFIATVADAGITTFIVHARKAWLSGLSPKENREIPPLDYSRVYRLKSARPELKIAINGGIETIEQCEEHLKHVDGVMVGRAAYQTPYMLAEVDQRLFGSETPVLSRGEVLQRLLPYVCAHLAQGGRLNSVVRHILGLYHGQPRARLFRRHLSEHGVGEGPGLNVLEHAIALAEGHGQMVGAIAAE